MTLQLKILLRARDDAQHIFDYIRERSPRGAIDWWLAFEDAAEKATNNSFNTAKPLKTTS